MEGTAKVFCTSFTRTGSTRLERAVRKLLDIKYEALDFPHIIGQPLSKTEVRTLIELPAGYLYKTHNASPRDFMSVVAEDREIKVVTIWRNFYDTLTSLIFYVARCRPRQKLSVEPAIESFLSEFGDLPDKAFLNLLIESRQRWVEQKLLQWLRFRHVVNSQNYFTTRFEEFLDDPESVVQKLAEFFDVELTEEKLAEVIEFISVDAMRAQYDQGNKKNKGFVRAAQEGDFRNWMDEETVERVRGMFEKYSEFKSYGKLPTKPIM